MQGKMPKTNYNASGYFLQRIVDFVKTHLDDKKVVKNLPQFEAYVQQHMEIAAENEQRRAQQDIGQAQRQGMISNMAQGLPTGAPAGGQPAPAPSAAPQMPQNPQLPQPSMAGIPNQ